MNPGRPPNPDVEPRVYKPEAGELSPWQKAQLDRFYVELDQTAAETQIKRARASARIRADDENRAAEHRDRDERRQSDLERERWERLDLRIIRFGLFAVLALSVLATIVLPFVVLDSARAEVRFSPGATAAVSIFTGLWLRALTPSGKSSIWDWLMRRKP